MGRVVRCCASKAAPPASRKPLLAGSEKNSLATSSPVVDGLDLRDRLKPDPLVGTVQARQRADPGPGVELLTAAMRHYRQTTGRQGVVLR